MNDSLLRLFYKLYKKSEHGILEGNVRIFFVPESWREKLKREAQNAGFKTVPEIINPYMVYGIPIRFVDWVNTVELLVGDYINHD